MGRPDCKRVCSERGQQRSTVHSSNEGQHSNAGIGKEVEQSGATENQLVTEHGREDGGQMNIWLKIGIEAVLATLVSYISQIYWILCRQPHYFKSALSHTRTIERAVERINSLDFFSPLNPESKLIEAQEREGNADAATYPVMLASYSSAAFQTWKRVKTWHFIGILVLLVGSYLLSWVFALINLSIFLLFKANKLSPDSPDALADVVRTVEVVTRLIQRWWKAEPEGCRRFCTELSPQFATVFMVVSKTGGIPAL
jgi:hypothetical protein